MSQCVFKLNITNGLINFPMNLTVSDSHQWQLLIALTRSSAVKNEYHKTAEDIPGAKKVTFLSAILNCMIRVCSASTLD